MPEYIPTSLFGLKIGKRYNLVGKIEKFTLIRWVFAIESLKSDTTYGWQGMLALRIMRWPTSVK